MYKFFTLILILAATVGCASPGGIGVLYNHKSIVRYVFEHSPAEKADIRLLDVISNTKALRGPIGSVCLVKYTRAGVAHEVSVIRADVDTFRVPDYGHFKQLGVHK